MAAVFLITNAADSATLTESSENSMLPVENIQNARAGKVWETTGASTSQNVVVNMGSATSASYVGIVHPAENLTPGNIQANATDSWGSPTFSEAITGSGKTRVHKFSASQNLQYYRVTFTQPSSTPSRMGRLFIGGATTLSENLDFEGFTISNRDRTTTIAADGGSYSDQRIGYKTLSMPYTDVSEAFKTIIQETIFDAVGTHTPFFVQPDDTETGADDWYYVKFAQAPVFENTGCSGGGLIWSVTLTLDEEIPI
ncbi:MAG: hypothetical protein VW907_09940 [Opitutae bacterium]